MFIIVLLLIIALLYLFYCFIFKLFIPLIKFLIKCIFGGGSSYFQQVFFYPIDRFSLLSYWQNNLPSILWQNVLSFYLVLFPSLWNLLSITWQNFILYHGYHKPLENKLCFSYKLFMYAAFYYFLLLVLFCDMLCFQPSFLNYYVWTARLIFQFLAVTILYFKVHLFMLYSCCIELKCSLLTSFLCLRDDFLLIPFGK